MAGTVSRLIAPAYAILKRRFSMDGRYVDARVWLSEALIARFGKGGEPSFTGLSFIESFYLKLG